MSRKKNSLDDDLGLDFYDDGDDGDIWEQEGNDDSLMFEDDDNNEDETLYNDSKSGKGDKKGRSGLIKSSIILIVVALVLVVGASVLKGFIERSKVNNNGDNTQQVQQTTEQQQVQQETQELPDSSNNTVEVVNEPVVEVEPVQEVEQNTNNEVPDISSNGGEIDGKLVNTELGWQELSEPAIVENVEKIEGVFTIKNIRHLVKNVGDMLVIKTILEGNVSGFVSEQTIELNYKDGSMLSVGNSFTVEVLRGTYEGKYIILGIEV